MKLINLSHKDPDIFQSNITSHRCNFILNHLEDFMHMYNNQGSTFWLRFIISFKAYTEEKIFAYKKFSTLIMNHQLKFFKVLNYVYICIHKRFIESTNNALEKFINNLITLTKNSPSFLKYTCDRWITHFKLSKQLQNILQNILSLSGPCTFDGYVILIYIVFSDFLCSLSAIFDQWVKKPDLSEEECEKIDYKLIYWLPPFDESDINVLCFEKYIAGYWKDDLQRMLLTDNINNIYGSHKTSNCCEKYSKENLFNTLHLPIKLAMELVKGINSEKDVDKYDTDDHMHTITEVRMKDISILKPFVKPCEDHENCCVRIHHVEDCREPFLCTGSSPCILTCNTNSKNFKKKHKSGKFWKNVSAEKFPVDGNKCDAATTAESSDKSIETYLHFKENIDDISMSFIKHSYHCMRELELHHLDFNPRKAECLNRLRKKLTQKNPLNSCQYNFSLQFYRNSLLTKAEESFLKWQEQFCEQRDHNFLECKGKCFLQLANTVAIDSADPFGRVIIFSKAYISVPPVEVCECEHSFECNSDSKAEIKKCESKKIIKVSSAVNKVHENPKSKSVKNKTQVAVSSSNVISEDTTTNIKATIDSNKEDSEADDEIDDILKLIGIDENEEVCHKSESESINYEGAPLSNQDVNYLHPNESETVDNFLKLIGVNDNNCIPEVATSGPLHGTTHDSKLKVCAYCKKKETQRKMFKKCSKCKEENFPVQHYYCSQECLIEDWIESHEREHLEYKK